MKFKEVVLSDASTEAKVAALGLLLDKELLKLADLVFNVKKLEGPKGEEGIQGAKGDQGDRGFDGTNGTNGRDGVDGLKGDDGSDGVGVADARIDFDGSLVIVLTNGKEINAGDVVPLNVTEKLKIVKSTSGTAQSVLEAIEAINTAIATYGTMATQNANAVAITGGTINGATVGATTPAAGTFTTLIGGGGSANYGQLTGGATTKAVEFTTLGNDTNIAAVIKTKGTGAIDLAAGSSGVNISNGGTVTAITRTAGGTGPYSTPPIVAITAPTTAGGVQATATSTLWLASIPTISAGGTGYTVGDTLTLVGGTSTSTAQVTVATVSAGVVTSVSIANSGSYTVAPSSPVSVTGGTGSGATLTISMTVSPTFTITNAGSGYVEQPTVTFSGGGGSGAAAYAVVGSGTVVRSIGSALDFYTPNQQIAFRVQDYSGSAATGYWTAFGGNATPILRAVGANSGAIQTASAVPIQFGTNNGVEQLRVSHTASAVNYVQVTGAATGGNPSITVQGSDASRGLNLTTKGTGFFNFYSQNGTNFQFRVDSSAVAAVNHLVVAGSATGVAPILSAQGSDTDIDLTLTPKGAGNVRFGTYTVGILAQTGYITVKDSGGTVRRLLVG